jgi:lantibiotic modifying enzyme|tara:strand:- start:1685 stop:2182 length:498 start_codon:yes stop_codon:yes gene_type:complete
MSKSHLANGRVPITDESQLKPFQLYDKIPTKSEDYVEAMNGNFYDTILSKAFFSSENQDIIQNGIRAGVYKASKNQYIIAKQNTDSLKTIMRSVFLQHATNLPTDIPGQIEALNKIVIEYSVKDCYSEAQSYMQYRHDLTTLVVPIDRPAQNDRDYKHLEYKNPI